MPSVLESIDNTCSSLCDAFDYSARDSSRADPSWPLHAKVVTTADAVALAALPASDDARLRWSHAQRWISDPSAYDPVPVRPAAGAPRVRMEDDHIKKMLDTGVIEQCRKCDVRGWCSLFLVPEFAKKRFRAIKHSFIINEFLGKETLLPCKMPSKKDICSLVHEGDCYIALDFAAWYDQFVYAEEIRSLVFRPSPVGL